MGNETNLLRIKMGELEILRLIAQLCVVLISVTIPTFAISVLYLGSESSRVMEKLENKRKETKRN